MTALIVNADDFGITEGVNRAVIGAHAVGSVTSATLMVNMPAAAHALALAERAPLLGIGWHVNLTLGKAIADPQAVSTLVDADGRFFSRHILERRLLLGRVDAADIRRELMAQFARFLAFGRRPTHIDSHQHMHAFPSLFNPLAELAETEGLPLRMPWPWPGVCRMGPRRRLRTLVLRAMLRRNSARLGGRLRQNTGFCSLFDRIDNPDEIETMLYDRLLAPYSSGLVELMVHPAEVDDALRALTRITPFSERESAWLMTGEMPRLAKRLGLRMTSYADESLWH